MSQRIGMADGRCLTNNEANRIFTDKLQKKAGIPQEDNYGFRKMLQHDGPVGVPLPNDSSCLKPFLLNPRDQ
jgi:hypothetical protein